MKTKAYYYGIAMVQCTYILAIVFVVCWFRNEAYLWALFGVLLIQPWPDILKSHKEHKEKKEDPKIGFK